MRPKVLAVGCEQNPTGWIRAALGSEFQVHVVGTGREGLGILPSDEFQLLFVGTSLPDMSGLEFLRLLSLVAKRQVPVVLLNVTDENDRVRALLAGAAGVISSPLGPRELRVRAKLLVEQGAPKLCCGNLQIGPNHREVKIDHVAVRLTSREIALVSLLIRNAGAILKRDQILDAIWKESPVNDRVVDNHIYKIKRKIVGWDHEIAAVYGYGYGIRPLKENGREK